MAELTEKQINNRLYLWQKEGMVARRTGDFCPYAGNTIAHAMYSSGWLQEDLRIALMEASPIYRATQADGKQYARRSSR